MAEKVQRYKYVVFDLPFVIFVKDSMQDQALRAWADAYVKGEKPLPYSRYAPHAERPGFMVVLGGFPVYLPPDPLAEYYLVSVAGIEVGIRFLRRVNPHRSTTLMGEVPGDRAGRASFSSVRVMFDQNSIDPQHHWDMVMYANLAIDAINKFITHYRVIADRPYVQPVTPAVIQEFFIETEFQDGSTQLQQFGSGSGPLHGFGGSISEEQDQELRLALAQPAPPPIDATLDSDVRDHLDLRKWRLALIESAVLFEAWLTSFIRHRFEQQGLSPAEVDLKLLRRDGAPASITSIAKRRVIECTGFDFASTQEYRDWEIKVRDIRNDLIHGKRFDVSGDDAVAAYAAVRQAIELLQAYR